MRRRDAVGKNEGVRIRVRSDEVGRRKSLGVYEREASV